MNTNTVNFAVDPVGALHFALRDRRNRISTLLGSAVAIVPIGGYYLGHCQITSWCPLSDPASALAYAALAFSATTVHTWGRAMFAGDSERATWWKAAAFATLVEGLMMFGGSDALAYAALALITLINVMTVGCKLAQRAQRSAEASVEPVAAQDARPVALTMERARPARYTPVSPRGRAVEAS